MYVPHFDSFTSATTARVTSTVILSVLLYLVVLAEGGHSAQGEVRSASQTPSSATDIEAVVNELGTILYLVDAETKLLYMHKVTGANAGAITLSDFQPFPAAQNFLRPTTLTHSGEKLYVCDQVGQAIYEVDTQAATISKIIEQTALPQPVSIAVSSKGVIAVGDAAGDQVVAFEPVDDPGASTKSYKRTVIGRDYDDPNRLIFVGDNLFVLETEQGKLFLVGDRRDGQTSNEEVCEQPPRRH